MANMIWLVDHFSITEGSLPINLTEVSIAEVNANFSNIINFGGHWEPTDCKPKYHVSLLLKLESDFAMYSETRLSRPRFNWHLATTGMLLPVPRNVLLFIKSTQSGCAGGMVLIVDTGYTGGVCRKLYPSPCELTATQSPFWFIDYGRKSHKEHLGCEH